MKRFVLGLICGIGLTATTAVYASDTIQAYLFPAKFVFNGVTKEVDNKEYVVLNHQGHAYVPIRFVAENMGALVKYEESTKTILLNETSLSKKLQLNEEFLSAVAEGKLPGIEFGIGATKKDVFGTWGEPQRTGSRGAHFDAWFDYNYFFTGPNQTVKAIGVSENAIKYSVEDVKKALGQPAYEGLSIIEDGWEMSYKVGEYVLFFSADKKEGTISDMTLKSAMENIVYQNSQYHFSVELPRSWEGTYEIKNNGTEYGDRIDFIVLASKGVLFSINIWSKEKWNTEGQTLEEILGNHVSKIGETDDKVFLLITPTDVQYNPSDEKKKTEYLSMFQDIDKIKNTFVIH